MDEAGKQVSGLLAGEAIGASVRPLAGLQTFITLGIFFPLLPSSSIGFAPRRYETFLIAF